MGIIYPRKNYKINYKRLRIEANKLLALSRSLDLALARSRYSFGTSVGGCLAYIYRIEGYDWISGANHFARKVGFPNRETLESFFSNNPSLWGNRFGHNLFVDYQAFKDKADLLSKENCLELAAKHLLDVADACELADAGGAL